jgi:hypothetical protein
MKYICVLTENGTHEVFTFPNTVNHDAMMQGLSRLKDKTYGNRKGELRVPVSAGFVVDGVCFGRSITLNISSRPEDTEILKAQNNGY